MPFLLINKKFLTIWANSCFKNVLTSLTWKRFRGCSICVLVWSWTSLIVKQYGIMKGLATVLKLQCYSTASHSYWDYSWATQRNVRDMINLLACDPSLKASATLFPKPASLKLPCCWWNIVPVPWKNRIQTI